MNDINPDWNNDEADGKQETQHHSRGMKRVREPGFHGSQGLKSTPEPVTKVQTKKCHHQHITRYLKRILIIFYDRAIEIAYGSNTCQCCFIIGAKFEMEQMRHQKYEQNGACDNHTSAAEVLLAGPTLALVFGIALRSRLSLVNPDIDACVGMHQEEQSQSRFKDVKKRTKAVKFVGVGVKQFTCRCKQE